MFEFLRSLFHEKSSYAPKKEEQDRQVFQYSTINALMEGLYQGTISYGELFEHGDFGLGTFDALDGEMVAVDGHFYQIKQDGKLSVVSAEQTAPFAVLVKFRPDLKFKVDSALDYHQLLEQIGNKLESVNFIYAMRVDAFFDSVEVRIAPRQCKPYPVLTEAAKEQPEFTYSNLRGTICGFRFPAYTSAINVPGYHMHFVDQARTIGGHVLDAKMHDVAIEIEQLSGFFVQLPTSSEFMAADLSADHSKEIRAAEEKKN